MMVSSTSLPEPYVQPTDDRIMCLNCDHPYVGQYCSQCGQQADTHRVNWRYLWEEVTESLWGVDRGILFTLRELITRPGYSIREFLAGRRISHYRPLALLLMLAAIYLFLSQVLHVDFLKMSQSTYGSAGVKTDSPAQMKAVLTSYFQFLDENQQFSDLAMVPFVAFWCWRLFRRSGYNYPEQLVAQTFIANFNLLFSILMILTAWALEGSGNALSAIMGASMLIQVGYCAFAYMQLYKGKLKPLNAALRSVTAYLLGYASFMLFTGLILFVYIMTIMISTGQPKASPKKVTPATSQHARL